MGAAATTPLGQGNKLDNLSVDLYTVCVRLNLPVIGTAMCRRA